MKARVLLIMLVKQKLLTHLFNQSSFNMAWGEGLDEPFHNLQSA